MFIRKASLFLIGLLLIQSITAFAGNRFYQLDTSDGIAGPLVRDITQDHHGFLWFATAYGLSRYDGYMVKNFYHNAADDRTLSSDNLWQLHVDHANNLWVITSAGVDKFNGIHFDRYTINAKTTSVESESTSVFIGTDQGIFQGELSPEGNDYQFHKLLGDVYVHDLHKAQTGKILAATDKGVFLWTTTTNRFNKLNFFIDSQPKITRLFAYSPQQVFAATNQQLFVLNLDDLTTKEIYPQIGQHIIQSISKDGDNLIIGTRKNGLYVVKNNQIAHYRYQANLKSSISENIITSSFIDKDRTLWVGTFSTGVNYQSYLARNFGLNQSRYNHLDCLLTSSINAIYELANKTATSSSIDTELLLGTNSGLFKVQQDASCQQLTIEPDIDAIQPRVYAIHRHQADEFFIGHSKGLVRYNVSTGKVARLFTDEVTSSVYYIVSNGDDLFFATYFKTYQYNLISDSLKELKHHNESLGSHQVGFINKVQPVFATHQGLYTLKYGTLQSLGKKSDTIINNLDIANLQVTDGHIWLANDYQKTIFKLNFDGEIINKYRIENEQSTIRFMAIQSQGDYLWVSSSNGIYRLNKNSGKFDQFIEADGLQSNTFIRNSSYFSNTGELYFGGIDGYNAFNPESIKTDQNAPKVILTELRHFNTVVEPKLSDQQKTNNDIFTIQSPIESLEQLTLGHKDYMISFEFAALNSADPGRNRYRYKVEGLHLDWIESSASNRHATLTNLPPGQYNFIVQGSNKDGLWSSSEDSVNLTIIVLPAPWMTWWAFTLYISAFILSVFLYIHIKTRKEKIRAKELELKVQQRTNEIVEKKNLIETLLEQKNQQFANISHEFRTPLTLILGPLEKELQDLNAPKSRKNLAMIERNSIRLYGMVEQILRLTELKKEQRIKKTSYSLNTVILQLVDLFKPLYEQKEIKINLKLDTDCNILAAKDALEIIFGNLISNAIKYTPINGSIEIVTNVAPGYVDVFVTDNGIGIEKSELNNIFQPYARVERSAEVVGNGLGLAIVKELVESHVGAIGVESSVDQGSTFQVNLPTSPEPAKNTGIRETTIKHLIQSDDLISTPEVESILNNEFDNQKNLVLIIEDNTDMLNYINETVSAGYETLLAPNGIKGIELALEHIPDLIICDLMMPGIDGYEVVRNIRNDEKTSHIPIILLTAKGDKQSRIQGWDENIDDYMTKPFDETELLARINNILSIRDILRDKAFNQSQSNNSANIDTHSNSYNHDTEKERKITKIESDFAISGLKPREQEFIDKLIKLIRDNYSKPDFQRSDMAYGLAVSERQLHRKVKALLNQNPIEILRDYRLEKSIELLRAGEQVGNVADLCGFSSPSYFSQCFKAKYGKSPKELI